MGVHRLAPLVSTAAEPVPLPVQLPHNDRTACAVIDGNSFVRWITATTPQPTVSAPVPSLLGGDYGLISAATRTIITAFIKAGITLAVVWDGYAGPVVNTAESQRRSWSRMNDAATAVDYLRDEHTLEGLRRQHARYRRGWNETEPAWPPIDPDVADCIGLLDMYIPLASRQVRGCLLEHARCEPRGLRTRLGH
jgi:hypothetical protein